MAAEIKALVQAAAQPASKSHRHLANAWREVYGRGGSPSEGYREAVRALECVMRPVVSPANDKATLGSMIADLENKTGNWECILVPSKGAAIEQVTSALRLVWTAQFDRHGDPAPDVPMSVSNGQAVAALHLAAGFIALFSGAAIRRL